MTPCLHKSCKFSKTPKQSTAKAESLRGTSSISSFWDCSVQTIAVSSNSREKEACACGKTGHVTTRHVHPVIYSTSYHA